MAVYDVLLPETYTDNGIEKAKYHRVGVAFDAKSGEGLSVELPAGLSLSGKFIIRPRKAKAEGIGLQEDEIPY